MADGRHLGFRFWAIIAASVNIFAPNFTPRWKIGSPLSSAQKSDFRKSKMSDGRHLGFRFWAISSASINIFAPNFTPRLNIGSPRGPSAQKADFRKSKMADGQRVLAGGTYSMYSAVYFGVPQGSVLGPRGPRRSHVSRPHQQRS